jgi:hypothetical protein
MMMMMNNNNNNNRHEHRYDHVPKSVDESHKGKVTILWDQQVRTDRTVPNNKQDIIIRDYKIGTCMSKGVAVLGDRNVIEKEAENFLKCRDLTTEIQRTWNMKEKMMPVIMDTHKYLSNIPGKYETKVLQKEPYWALHTYCGKCQCESTKHI